MSDYLTLQGTTYHFRYFIPEPLQPTIGKKVIKISLKTGRKRLAKRKAGQLASATRNFLHKAKERDVMDPLALQQTLRTYLKYLIDMDDALRAAPASSKPTPPEDSLLPPTAGPAIAEAELARFFLDKVTQSMQAADNKGIQCFVDEYRSMCGLEPLPVDSLEYNLVARQMHKVLVQFAHVSKLRAEGDVIAEQEYLGRLFPESTFHASPSQITPVVSPPAPTFAAAAQIDTVPVTDLIDDFINATDVTRETKIKYDFSIREFLEIAGVETVQEINHRCMRDYIDVLKSLPPNYTKRHPNMAAVDVAKLEHEKTVSARTINDKIGIVSRFFKWAINQGYMEVDYADGKRLPKGKPQHSTHEAYTIEDLRKMFSAPAYENDTFRSPYQFWMIPLALYTGARQSELAQLRCDDLYKADDIWCIRIRPDDEDDSSRVKTVNAIRTVPLHPVLTDELNFPAFVERVHKAGHDRVFPEIKPRQGKYGKVVSQWFNDRFKGKLDIQPPRAGFKKDFHSFRNTFINAAKQARVDISIIEETVGHASALGNRPQSMSGDYYASHYTEKIRYEELMLKVRFDVELDLLKRTKHAG